MQEHMKNTLIIVLLIFSSNLLCVQSNAAAPAPQSFNVQKNGAKGGRETDSTDAFGKALIDTCSAEGEAEMYVPEGDYLVQPVVFQGKCKCPNPTVRIEGSMVGPTDYAVISKVGWWIQFKGVDNLVIQGGKLVGRRSYLCQCNSTQFNDPKCPFAGKELASVNPKLYEYDL